MLLLETAYAEAEGYAEIVVGRFSQDKLHIDGQKWFNLPDEYDSLVAYTEDHSDQDVYFTPSTFRDFKRTPTHTRTTRLLWADADTCSPDEFRVFPTFVVETSPGKYQCFWMLDDNYPTSRVSELAHRVCWAHREEGCDTSSWPANKIMRVPGSHHTKTGKPVEVRVVNSTGELFDLDQLEQAYADVEPPVAVTVEDLEMGPLPSKESVIEKIPNELQEIFLYGHQEGSDRSSVRFRFEIDLLREGLTPEETFVAVQLAGGGTLDKFTPQGRPQQLWHEVLKAQATVESTPVEELMPAPKPVREEEPVSFLSAEERRWVRSHPTFVDEYVQWVKSRSPLSAETYQRSLAFMVLSAVYGNWGYVHPQFGKMSLNLWTIVAGDTTATRKSTARSLALKIIHAWEARSGRIIDIGSDATAEALVSKLSERDGQVSLLHRDEFQGFLKELFTKNYMSGMAERMTELYDGKVMQVLRASNKQAASTARVSTVFDLLMLGITAEIAQVLTTKNFASGFLPRFLWSVAEPPEWKPEHEDLHQILDDDEVKGEDPAIIQFTNQFELARRAWNSTSPKKILADEETWDRWLQWKRESKDFIRGLPNEAIMEPARDRMSYSILKAAALMAIHGRSDTIRMEHLLPVLAQAELWFTDMRVMANSIAASDFEAKVDRLEMLVAGSTNGALLMSKVYNNVEFKSMRKGEVEEYIRSLVAQNRAAEQTIDGKKHLVVRKED